MAQQRSGGRNAHDNLSGRSGLPKTPGDSNNKQTTDSESLRQDDGGEETKSRLKDVINNYNSTAKRNSEVERNTGGKEIADPSSDRGNSMDEGNGRTTSKGSACVDKYIPLSD